ncbi:MAG: Acetyltransferase, family [Chlamydiales bacterium]|nr:Acetyltransferase, family [Chlamydiales bacterium]
METDERPPLPQDTPLPKGLEVRYTVLEDVKHLAEWLSDPLILQFFPLSTAEEIEDSAQRWVGFCRMQSSLTVLKDGVPCGLATLYLQPYRKLLHQSEMGIIVGRGFRNQGIGSYLLKSIIHLAKEKFKIELLHLQVCDQNPAIRLYKRFGFQEFGRQSNWIKNRGVYTGRVMFQKFL